MKEKAQASKPRNHVAIALMAHGGKTVKHGKSNKAMRKHGKLQTQRECSNAF